MEKWPIEIDGLPFLKMVDLSMAMLNNQRVLSDDQILWTTPSHSQLHLTACEAAVMEHGDVDAVVLRGVPASLGRWGALYPLVN